jgi:hypothetical protein
MAATDERASSLCDELLSAHRSPSDACSKMAWRMSDDATRAAPRHPDVETRSLVAWLGYHSGLTVRSLDRRVVGAIAKPLAHAILDSGVVADALRAGFGVVVPSQTWRNQLPLDHPKRTGSFSRLGIHRPDRIIRPDAERMSAVFAETYAADDVAAQLAAGATLMLSSGHVLEEECRDARLQELLLARLGAEEFAARRGWRPQSDQLSSRQFFATIVLQGHHAANPAIIDWLVRAYAELEGVDGYWIVAANTNRSGRQLCGYARLGLSLQELTRRPSSLSGVSDEHLAMLASGVAATCAGLHGMSFRFPPDPLPESEDGDEDVGIGIYTYHPAVLGNAGRLGEEGDALRRALFFNRPCRCGYHEPKVPPLGKAQIVGHNAWSVSRDARRFAVPAVEVAETVLAARADRARRQRGQLGMRPLRPGFRAISIEAQKLRQRPDADADEQR